jgi:uncharacterized repeat protein (TIGR03843 family)
VSLLRSGTVDIEGRMPWSSNGTFLCSVTGAAPSSADAPASAPDAGAPSEPEPDAVHAIYKPYRTERPLWDFPGGLYRREIAAFELAVALGWDMVPETIERSDVPLGVGSLQLFIDANFEQHYFTLLEDPAHHAALKRIAVFDVVANNADRKGGHCLIDDDDHIWGIDHGLCFHPDPKLRTVIWDWAGEPIEPDLIEDVAGLVERGPDPRLAEVLKPDEVEAMMARAGALARRGRFPNPRSERPYPWPLV